MTRPSSLRPKFIIALALTQINALVARPALGVGLPGPYEALVAALAKVEAAEKKQESAKKAIKLATDEVQQALFELRGMLNANRAIAAMLHGPYSAEFVVLGGKPRKTRRTPSAEVVKTAGTTGATTNAA